MSALLASGALWYLSRGAGVISLVLFSLVMVLGILNRGGRTLPGMPRFATYMLHRYASLLALSLLAVHVISAVLDPYVTIRWVDALVPFISDYHPIWLGLGALSLDLMIALVVTSLLRKRIGARTWRALHWAAYLSWPVAVVHAFTMGPDVTSGAFLVVALAAVGASVAALRWRSRPARPARPGVKAVAQQRLPSGTTRDSMLVP